MKSIIILNECQITLLIYIMREGWSIQKTKPIYSHVCVMMHKYIYVINNDNFDKRKGRISFRFSSKLLKLIMMCSRISKNYICSPEFSMPNSNATTTSHPVLAVYPLVPKERGNITFREEKRLTNKTLFDNKV